MDIKHLFMFLCILGLLAGSSLAVFSEQSVSSVLGHLLEVDGVKYSKIEVENSTVRVYIDVTNTVDYDEELVMAWGFIFSEASNFAYFETIEIVNTVENEPVVVLRTSRQNVLNYLDNSEMTDIEFWTGVQMESLDTAAITPDKTTWNEYEDYGEDIAKFPWFLAIVIVALGVLGFFIFRNAENRKKAVHHAKRLHKHAKRIVNNVKSKIKK